MSGNIKKIVEPNSGIDYSLEKDFNIFTLSKELPITTYPSYIRLGIVIYCVKGNAKIDIYSNKANNSGTPGYGTLRSVLCRS